MHGGELKRPDDKSCFLEFSFQQSHQKQENRNNKRMKSWTVFSSYFSVSGSGPDSESDRPPPRRESLQAGISFCYFMFSLRCGPRYCWKTQRWDKNLHQDGQERRSLAFWGTGRGAWMSGRDRWTQAGSFPLCLEVCEGSNHLQHRLCDSHKHSGTLPLCCSALLLRFHQSRHRCCCSLWCGCCCRSFC